MKRVFAHIGFSTAITLVVLNLLKFEYAYAITIGLAVIFAASLILPVFRKAAVVPLCIGSAIFASLIFICFYNGTVAPQLEMNNNTVNTSFYIIDVEEYDGNNYSYTVKTTELVGDGLPQNIKLKIKSDIPIDASDYQVVKADVFLYEVGKNAFTSYGYWGKDVYMIGRINSYTVTDEFIRSPWRYTLQLRRNIIEVLSSKIKGDSGALAIALLTGNKLKLSDECYTDFKCAGASHIMAVSGFHLTVLVGMIAFLLKKLRVNDKLSAVISIFIILSFIGVAGFSKSVLRAGIMMLVMIMAKLINRRADGINSLGIAVFIICLNPFAVSDIGAQLSVLSVLSLLTIYPYFVKLADKNAIIGSDGLLVVAYSNKFFSFFSSGFLVAFSVMIYSMPVMYLFFGYVSIAGLVSNIFIVPLGSLCIISSIVAYMSIKLNIFVIVFTKICAYLDAVLLWLLHKFASVQGSLISMQGYFGFVFAVIAIAFAVCFFMNNKELMKKVGVASMAVVILVFSLSFFINNKTANVLVCKNGAVAVCCDDKALVYNVSTKGDYYSVAQFLLPRCREVDTIISPDNNEYSKKLAENHGCYRYVTSEFDNDIMNISNITELECCLDYSDNYVFDTEYHKNNDIPYCLFTLNNVTIAVGNEITANTDIVISGKCAEDYYGKINISDNEIIYTVNSSGVYQARRVGIWQE